MRIAVYFDVPPGGASRTMEEIIQRLSCSHELSVFHNLPQSINQPFLKHFFADLESVLIQRFKQRHQAKIIDSQNYDLVFVSHDRHSQAPWILRFLKTPTVFLCQEPTRSYFEYFLRIDPQLPIINRIYESLNRLIRKNLEIANSHYATKIIANSNYSTESIFRAYGCISSPIHLGVDSKQYFPEKVNKENQVLVVGNHEPQKNLVMAIKAISLINKSKRPTLVIASPRSVDNSQLICLAKNKKVPLKILIGLNKNELRSEYCRSFATLAVAHLEPFGLSVIESLACGTPVIAVSEGGFRETIINGRTGFLVEQSSQAIADKVLLLQGNQTLAKSMGALGSKDVNTRFTWEITVDKIENIFHEIKSK